jgi:hypothetical protein
MVLKRTFKSHSHAIDLQYRVLYMTASALVCILIVSLLVHFGLISELIGNFVMTGLVVVYVGIVCFSVILSLNL